MTKSTVLVVARTGHYLTIILGLASTLAIFSPWAIVLPMWLCSTIFMLFVTLPMLMIVLALSKTSNEQYWGNWRVGGLACTLLLPLVWLLFLPNEVTIDLKITILLAVFTFLLVKIERLLLKIWISNSRNTNLLPKLYSPWGFMATTSVALLVMEIIVMVWQGYNPWKQWVDTTGTLTGAIFGLPILGTGLCLAKWATDRKEPEGIFSKGFAVLLIGGVTVVTGAGWILFHSLGPLVWYLTH